MVGEDICEGPEKLIMEAEVLTAIQRLKCNKAGRPTRLVGDIFKAAGNAGVKTIIVLYKILFEINIPNDWELSIPTFIYKGKGDPLNCGSFWAINRAWHEGYGKSY